MTRPAASGLQTHLIVAEDNEAVIKIIKKCRSVALRHLPRTHRIDVTWLFEVCGAEEVKLRHVGTDEQVADLMTKAFTSPEKWRSLLEIAQIVPGVVEPRQQKQVSACLVYGHHIPTCYSCGFRVLPGATCYCDWS